MEKYDDLQEKLIKEFLSAGFLKEAVGDREYLVRNNSYYILSYVSGFNGFVLEGTDIYEEAEKGMLEDIEIYSLNVTGEELIKQIKEDIRNY